MQVRARDQDRAHDHDAVNRVGARHKRGVQERRYLGDDLDAEEDRQDQHRQLSQENGRVTAHGFVSFLVTQAPLMISSSKLSTRAVSYTSSPSSEATCLLYTSPSPRDRTRS